MRNPIAPDFGSGLAAGASLAAGIIHLAVTPDHLSQWWGYGAFFAALAAFQSVWAFLILRTTRRSVSVAGIAVNGAAIALWAASRTTGIGIGPDGARAHSVGWPDLVTVIVELVVIAQTARLMTRRHHARRSTRKVTPWLAAALAVAGTALTASAVAAATIAPEHDHSHPSSPGHDEQPGHHLDREGPAEEPATPSDGTTDGPAVDDDRPAEHHDDEAESHSH